MRTAAPRVLVVLGVASLLGLFSALLAYSFRLASSEPASWWHVFPLNLSYWWTWAALTPFVFWMARRYRFERHSVWRPLLAHLPAAAVTSLVHVMTLSMVMGLLAGRLSWGWWLSDVRRSYWMSVDWEMVTYWALVGTSHALHYYAALRQREIAAVQLEARLAEARLQSLQRQLHPHFLFNTLHGISALMHRDLAAADRMLALLGDLLRSSLRMTAQEIPLKDELELLDKYVEIEQTRFRDRLTVSYDIPGETLDARVPSLILQPLVENAIDHGIAPNAGRGHLEIRARRHGGQLWLEVRDDGVGLRVDVLAEDLITASGIGVSNTRSRLQCLYGAAHQFEFCRDGGRGLTVRVVIPWREAAGAAVAAGELVT
jgi:hypothetical protein